MPSSVALSRSLWPNRWAATTAVMACGRVSVDRLILVNAMVPAPGETPGEWWAATGAITAATAAAQAVGYDSEFDLETYFLHDLTPEDAAAVLADPGHEADITFGQPCDIEAWPDVATAAIIGRDDRLFPVGFQRELLHRPRWPGRAHRCLGGTCSPWQTQTDFSRRSFTSSARSRWVP